MKAMAMTASCIGLCALIWAAIDEGSVFIACCAIFAAVLILSEINIRRVLCRVGFCTGGIVCDHGIASCQKCGFVDRYGKH